jgi:hypothetical protein
MLTKWHEINTNAEKKLENLKLTTGLAILQILIVDFFTNIIYCSLLNTLFNCQKIIIFMALRENSAIIFCNTEAGRMHCGECCPVTHTLHSQHAGGCFAMQSAALLLMLAAKATADVQKLINEYINSVQRAVNKINEPYISII